MHKVYLLLRNNQQTGPYSLDQLLQLNLKPFDLVWVEGRSAAWRYPGEIDSLKPYVAEMPVADRPYDPLADIVQEQVQAAPPPVDLPEAATTPKKIFVSMPGKAPQVPLAIYEEQATPSPYSPVADPIAQKAEELARRVQSYNEQKPAEEKPVHTNYSRSMNEVEEDYTTWLYRQKTKKKKTLQPRNIAIAACVLGLVVAGYFILSKPARVQPSVTTAGIAATPIRNESSEFINADNTNNSNTVDPSATLGNEPVNKKNSGSKRPGGLTAKTAKQNEPLSTVTHPIEEKTAGEKPQEAAAEKRSGQNSIATQEEPAEEKTASGAESKKEKKKLRDVVKEIFGKKEKKEPATTQPAAGEEEPKPATNRQAQRRSNGPGEAEEATTTSSLADGVTISSNAPDNWMMGVSGLKVTLHNRNTVPLQTAAVNVLYYNDNNQVLEKKTVYFNNVPAKGKLTVPAPDHKFADHVEFRLGGVTGKDDRYARE